MTFDLQADSKAWAAKVTPSVVVEIGGRVLYRGRIDDRAAAFGVMRPNGPTRADLRIALDEILAGKPVTVAETVAVGCAISDASPDSKKPRVTYARDVAPLLNRYCVECHRPGQSGPFPLLTYTDAAPRAAALAQAVAGRIMPPWKAEPQAHRFQGERRMTATEIEVIQTWASAGAPAGDLAKAPKTPVFPDSWRLGKPDLVAALPKVFEVPADGPDLYRCFIVPVATEGPKYVRAFEFRPGARQAVHHALFFVDATGAARRNNPESPYPCFGLPGFLPSGSLGGWTPGFTPAPYPEGTAVRLAKGAALVFQIHYHPTGQRQTDRSEIALYFGTEAPKRPMMDVALGSKAIDIPAGEGTYTVRDHFTLPVDVWATGIIPHAHYICKRMRGWAVLPSGERIDLITINDWDFNWQQHYRYEQPFQLPADTEIEMEFIYDNSAGNPRNPFSPPRRVVWGPESTDEMAGLHLQVIPVRTEDASELGRALWSKIMRELGGGVLRRPEQK